MSLVTYLYLSYRLFYGVLLPQRYRSLQFERDLRSLSSIIICAQCTFTMLSRQPELARP